MKLQNKNGFTLIELLVVITIIGILATGAVAQYTSQIQKARDTTRITDIKTLESSVQQSYGDKSEFPKSSELTTELVKYVQGKIPGDSKNGQPCSGSGAGTDCGYAYIVSDDTNGIQYGEYELSSAFENSGNTETKGGKDGGDDTLRLEIGNNIPNVSTKINKGTTASFKSTKGIYRVSDGSTTSIGDKDLVVINGNP